jgi:plastocyanin
VRRRAGAAVAVALAAILVGGCGEGDADAPESVMADISGFAFEPDPIRVRAGGTVTWRNVDNAPHTAETDGKGFDTRRLDLGESKTVSIEEPGTYQYFCVFHRFMTGTVEVVE